MPRDANRRAWKLRRTGGSQAAGRGFRARLVVLSPGAVAGRNVPFDLRQERQGRTSDRKTGRPASGTCRMIATTTWAFVRRDYLGWASYRTSAVWQLMTMLVTVILVYLVGRTVGDSVPSLLSRYSTDYGGYLMTSLTFLDIWTAGFNLPRVL